MSLVGQRVQPVDGGEMLIMDGREKERKNREEARGEGEIRRKRKERKRKKKKKKWATCLVLIRGLFQLFEIIFLPSTPLNFQNVLNSSL